MFFSQDRSELRRFYLEAWHKARAGLPMAPLEQMVAAVVAEHPEYQPLLENEERALERDYRPEHGETNPFLHMALHIAVREQAAADRPRGVYRIHTALSGYFGGRTETEHRMMECLAETLWHAQRYNVLPDEAAYMACLEALARRILGNRNDKL
ncbi:DUF1841 family protein [Nitrococcus mobilis]|uniref:DUF1841 domain-containing protein n=1 Tax=Nitrococcus mobilis Nb-231 TaxID=314278 RepID=A4BN64_9GAMM|nr:DUF1841 family protein [Nitrococcus mobilis]EAR22663.1 hypothetical protein NB231_09433 [Nitrococcus mobilis Nb-231]